MKRKYQKPTSLDLGDVLLTAHGSCKSGGIAGKGKDGCNTGLSYAETAHCTNGSVAYKGRGACLSGNTAEAECSFGSTVGPM